MHSFFLTQWFDIGGLPTYWLHDPRLYSCDNRDVVERLGVGPQITLGGRKLNTDNVKTKPQDSTL